jgi:hypothetical protein
MNFALSFPFRARATTEDLDTDRALCQFSQSYVTRDNQLSQPIIYQHSPVFVRRIPV